jgi:5-methylcytosine-specific restriction enzyme B
MCQIKNLYTHLVENRRAELNEWLGRYKKLSQDVKIVRAALSGEKQIQDAATYTDTSFEGHDNPWHALAEYLIYARRNGISSRGQWVLSSEKFEAFIKDPQFVGALAELIKNPDRDSFIKFTEAWDNARQKYGANANPLLINRTVAACTTNVSTTVNSAAFDSVYDWLVREGVVQKYHDSNAGWYDKNVQVMAELHRVFEEELKSDKKDKPDEYLLSLFCVGTFRIHFESVHPQEAGR